MEPDSPDSRCQVVLVIIATICFCILNPEGDGIGLGIGAISGTGLEEPSEIVRRSVLSRSTLTPVEDAGFSSRAVPKECLRRRPAGLYVPIGEAGHSCILELLHAESRCW